MKITRRHHPLRDRELEVLIQQGKTLLVVRLPDGSAMRMPRAWTDADGSAVPEELSVTCVYTPDSLRELLGLVDALRARHPCPSAAGVCYGPSVRRDHGHSANVAPDPEPGATT
ncbi:MAG: hypothetical protein HYU88_08645 [Chloroflexi bacterium]|nr:hypothetical protein [Chloroflexota bacterium]